MMRQLSIQEIQNVAGAYHFSAGNNNLSTEMWRRMHADAQREAAMSGAFAGGLLGIAAVSFGAPLVSTMLVATIVGCAVYQHDYENYEFWPWNF